MNCIGFMMFSQLSSIENYNCSCYDVLVPPPPMIHMRQGDTEIIINSRDDSMEEKFRFFALLFFQMVNRVEERAFP